MCTQGPGFPQKRTHLHTSQHLVILITADNSSPSEDTADRLALTFVAHSVWFDVAAAVSRQLFYDQHSGSDCADVSPQISHRFPLSFERLVLCLGVIVARKYLLLTRLNHIFVLFCVCPRPHPRRPCTNSTEVEGIVYAIVMRDACET